MSDTKEMTVEVFVLQPLSLKHSNGLVRRQGKASAHALSSCNIVVVRTTAANGAGKARHKYVKLAPGQSSADDTLSPFLHTHYTKAVLITRRTSFNNIMAFDALYEQQGRGFEKYFRGKALYIRRQHESFWAQRSAKDDVVAYLNRTPGHIFPPINKWVQADTIFTTPDNERFAESKNAFLIGNFASFDVAQYADCPGRAGMSMIHLLALPKAAIFNGVSLDQSNIWIIDEMIALFKAAWPRPTVREAVLRHQLMAIERQRAAQLASLEREPQEAGISRAVIEAGYQTALEHYKELETMIDALSIDDFEFGLHLFPDQSISHLHLHIVAVPRELRRYSTSENDSKTKDAIEVRDYIKRLHQPQPKFKKLCGFL